MKNQTNTNFAIRSGLALGLALAVALTFWSPVQAQDTEPAAGKTDAKMIEHCEQMKAQKQKMKEEMKAQDAELTEHVAKMNSAPQDKKMDLMAAVLTHMVEQRIAMDAQMAKMDEEKMQHMMQHMQMDKESMAQCPMMKGMKAMDEKAAGDHNEHKAEQK